MDEAHRLLAAENFSGIRQSLERAETLPPMGLTRSPASR